MVTFLGRDGGATAVPPELENLPGARMGHCVRIKIFSGRI